LEQAQFGYDLQIVGLDDLFRKRERGSRDNLPAAERQISLHMHRVVVNVSQWRLITGDAIKFDGDVRRDIRSYRPSDDPAKNGAALGWNVELPVLF
jgi:hypothetical protein